jgi:putative transposase
MYAQRMNSDIYAELRQLATRPLVVVVVALFSRSANLTQIPHLPVFGGTKRYSFVAIDTYSKQASVFVSSTISSTAGVKAWQRAKSQLNLNDSVTVVTDNGSENYGAFERLLKDQGLVHYFARPRTPKDKPVVERFIGTLEKECIQWGGIAIDKQDQQQIIDDWLDKYHNYRPHQSLGYLTPNEFKAKIDMEVSSMY